MSRLKPLLQVLDRLAQLRHAATAHFQGMIAVCSAAVERDAGAVEEARRLLSTASHVGMELGLPPNSELMRSVTEVRITV